MDSKFQASHYAKLLELDVDAESQHRTPRPQDSMWGFGTARRPIALDPPLFSHWDAGCMDHLQDMASQSPRTRHLDDQSHWRPKAMDLVDVPAPSSLNSEYLSRASSVTRQNHWLVESVPFSAPSSSSLASENTSMTPQAHWPAATSTAVPWDASSSSSSLVQQTKPIKATLPALRNGNNSSNISNSGKHASPSPRPTPRGDGGNNSTVFVGGLSALLSENELCQYFAPFGPIAQVRIPPGKGCGFVQFRARSSAEDAIANMNGFQIGHSRIRLAWGRSSMQK